MAKNNRKGKAKVWDERAIRKMRSLLPAGHHRLIFEIGLYTGERIGAIVQLKVSDVYDSAGKVLDMITFAGSTRKSSKHGQAKTRQIFVHDDLRLHLASYNCSNEGYLFPSRAHFGHITARAIDKMWRGIFVQAGLIGYSTHSSRHWIINKMRSNGVDTSTIADAMAIDVATVRNYLRYDPERAKNAIASIRVA